MRSIRVMAVVLTAVLALVSCSRDPNAMKKRFLESGNRYYSKNRFKEARIQYLNSTKADPRYGMGYYKLGLTDLKLTPVPNVAEAVRAFRRAIELISPNDQEHWDAAIKISELYLVVARNQKQYIDEVEGYCKQLVQRKPNEFDGRRLYGDLHFVRAIEAFKVSSKDQGMQELNLAAEQYRLADGLKPDQMGVIMQLARVLEARNELATAEQLYRKAIAKDKTFQTESGYVLAKQGPYMELYRLLVFQKKQDEGEQVLKLAIQNNPKQYLFLTILAMHYALANRRDDMAGVLQQIKSHSKDWDLAYFTVGDFYLRMGDGDSALREYREGMTKEPKKKVDFQKRIIEVLMRQGTPAKRAEAAEVNAQILKDNPNDNDSRGLAATLLLDRGDINKALAELQSVVTHAPDNAVARYNLGRAYAARGENEQARQSFQKAIELRPDYILARLALAQLQVLRNEYDAALKSAEQVLQIDRGNANALLIQSAALMGAKRFGESRALLNSMLKQSPNSPDAFFQLGVVNLQENKYKEAEDSFRRVYELNPENPRGLMGVVETYMAQNRSDQAMQLLEAETRKAPNRLDLLMATGNVAVRSGKYDAAIADYQKLLVSLEDKQLRARGDVFLRIGETYRRKGDYANAINYLQKSRELLPDNEIVLSTLGLVLDSGGRKTEAMQVYDAILKINPNNPVVLNNKAFMMAETSGDLDQALTLAQRAKQLLPNLGEVADTMGWIYLKKNQADNAIDIFKDLVAKNPHQSTYHYHLGMAFSQKGDKPKALKELSDALNCNPAKEEKEKIISLKARLQ